MNYKRLAVDTLFVILGFMAVGFGLGIERGSQYEAIKIVLMMIGVFLIRFVPTYWPRR